MLITMLQEQSNHPRHMVLEISCLQIRKEKYLITASCGVKADVVLEISSLQIWKGKYLIAASGGVKVDCNLIAIFFIQLCLHVAVPHQN